ncbi:ABC transporter substrate-binding protein [Sodalis-like symbiont of Philaenus spumarius]|nr:ABC transporter substrate-binding protein [Sodalis-like symbiont of Philaenus spumarius]
MQSEEQRLIEGLFQRLKQAEQNTGPRDVEADRQIQSFIQQQPSAPYYMAQSMLIQEAALNRLNQQVQQLQNEVAQLKATAQQRPAGGGFLRGLFSTGRQQPSAAPWGNQPSQQQEAPGGGNPSPQPQPAGYSGYSQPYNSQRGGGFLSGALQTAAGVAGGVVLGNMLTNMFHQSAPQEIVNIIDDPTASLTGCSNPLLNQDFNADNLDTFNNVSDSHFSDQNSDSGNKDYNDFGADDFSNDDDDFI